MPNTNIDPPRISGDAGQDDTLSALAPAQTYDDEAQGWAGVLSFGGTMAILIGILHGLSGLTALSKPGFLAVPKGDLVVAVDYPVWGWVHLLFGVVAIGIGWGVLRRQLWARIGGVVFAGLSIVLNLGFLDAKPIWSTLVIAFDVVLIWGLTAHGQDAPRRTGTRPRWQSPYGPS
jgi:hypothetical protein